MYTRGYGYVKGGFNWTMPPPKGQQLKSHTADICSDKCSHPLFSLILVLSTFLAMSAAILTVSEYWAMEVQSAGNCPCSALESSRGRIGTLVSPRPWDRFKDRQILVIGSPLIGGEDRELLRIAELCVSAGARVGWVSTPVATPGSQSLKDRFADSLVRLNGSEIEILSSKQALILRAISRADLILSRPCALGKLLEASGASLRKDMASVLRKSVLWVKGRRKGDLPKVLLTRNLTGVGALLAPLRSTADFWKREYKREIRADLPAVHVVPTAVSESASSAADSANSRKLLRSFLRQSLDLREGSFVVTLFSNSESETEKFLASLSGVFEGALKKSPARPPVQAVVVGQWESATSGNSTGQALQLSRGANAALRLVHFAAEKVPYILASDAVLFNSEENQEAYLQEMVDSLFLRTPVLATESEEFREILQNGTTALFHSRGQAGVAQVGRNILALAGNRGLRQKMAANGFEHAKRAFGHRQAHEQTARVMRRVMRQVDSLKKKKRGAEAKLAWEVV